MKGKRLLTVALVISVLLGQNVYAHEYTSTETSVKESVIQKERLEEQTEESVLEFENTSETESETEELILVEGRNIVPVSAGETAIASFVPNENVTYSFVASVKYSATGYFCDNEMNVIETSEIFDVDNSFVFKKDLQSCQTYYMCIKFIDTSISGNAIIEIQKINVPSDEEIVQIEDEALKSELLGCCDSNGDGYITYEEIGVLESLYLDGCSDIQDISALQYASNLRELILSNTNVNDISALTGLSNLETLNLNNTPIQDITPLTSLSTLNSLSLSNTNVNDITPLSSLVNLESLSIERTSVQDITPLAFMSKLSFLNFSFTEVNDYTVLSNLTHLYNLRMQNILIEDFDIIDSLSELKYFYFSPGKAPAEKVLQLYLKNKQKIELFEDYEKLLEPFLAGTMEGLEIYLSITDGGDVVSIITEQESMDVNATYKLKGQQAGFATLHVIYEDVAADVSIEVKELPEDAVHFNDKNLRTLLIEQYDTNGDEYISYNELAAVTSLSLAYSEITDLCGLEYAINLEKIFLDGNTGLTDIAQLFQLEKLTYAKLEDTGVSAETKMELAGFKDCEMWAGDSIRLADVGGVTPGFQIIYDEGEEYLEQKEYSGNVRITGKKAGTAKLRISFEDIEQKITVNIKEYEIEQYIGEDCKVDISYSGDPDFDVNEQVCKSSSIILDSNGQLWNLYPEAEVIQDNVKSYVATWVYDNGKRGKKYSCSIDNNNSLWVDGIRVVDNLVSFNFPYAIDENGTLYDVYSELDENIFDVITVLPAGSRRNYEDKGYNYFLVDSDCYEYTYILQSDGTLLKRKEHADGMEQETFEVCDTNVKQLSPYGYYLKQDGSCWQTDGNHLADNVASLHTSMDGYYAENNDFWLNRDRLDYINVGTLDVEQFDSDYILTRDGELYWYDNETKKIEFIAENVEGFGPRDWGSSYADYLYCLKDGTYIKADGSIMTEGVVKRTNMIDTYGDNNYYTLYLTELQSKYVIQKNGVTRLKNAVDIWANGNRVYALRTDGTIWDVTESPFIVLDVKNATTQLKVATVELISAADNGKGGIVISWKGVENVDGYRIYVKTADSSWKGMVNVEGNDVYSYIDTTAVYGVEYTYTVRAYRNTDDGMLLGDFDAGGVTSVRYPATVVLDKAKPDNSNSITVSWTGVTDIDGYRIYRKSSNSGWQGLANVGADTFPEYIDEDIEVGKTYTYTVRAYKNVNGKAVYGDYDRTGVSAQTLSTVVLKNAQDNGKGGIVVNWEAAEGAEGYRIYRRTSDKGWIGLNNINSADGTCYVDVTGTVGTTYTYTVRAYTIVDNKTIMGGFDNLGVRATKLPAIVALKYAKDDGNGGINISWDTVDDATGYRIYRKTVGGSWKGLDNVTSGNIDTYTDVTGEIGTTYVYTVRAYKTVNESTVYGGYDTDGVSTTKLPVTVRMVSAVSFSGKIITVNWEKVDDCTGYLVYRKDSSTGWTRMAKITDSNTINYSDTTGTDGTIYTYTVRAYKVVNGKEFIGGFDRTGVSAQCEN